MIVFLGFRELCYLLQLRLIPGACSNGLNYTIYPCEQPKATRETEVSYRVLSLIGVDVKQGLCNNMFPTINDVFGPLGLGLGNLALFGHPVMKFGLRSGLHGWKAVSASYTTDNEKQPCCKKKLN